MKDILSELTNMGAKGLTYDLKSADLPAVRQEVYELRKLGENIREKRTGDRVTFVLE